MLFAVPHSCFRSSLDCTAVLEARHACTTVLEECNQPIDESHVVGSTYRYESSYCYYVYVCDISPIELRHDVLTMSLGRSKDGLGR